MNGDLWDAATMQDLPNDNNWDCHNCHHKLAWSCNVTHYDCIFIDGVTIPIIIIKQGISVLADQVSISLASPWFRFSFLTLLYVYKHKFEVILRKGEL